MFWIHGGGNVQGGSDFYDGAALAVRQNVVVVSANYRLGPFGWLRHAALREGATYEEASGNFGTLDLDPRAALGAREHRRVRRQPREHHDLRRERGRAERGRAAPGAARARPVPWRDRAERRHALERPRGSGAADRRAGEPAAGRARTICWCASSGQERLARMTNPEIAAFLRAQTAEAIIGAYPETGEEGDHTGFYRPAAAFPRRRRAAGSRAARGVRGGRLRARAGDPRHQPRRVEAVHVRVVGARARASWACRGCATRSATSARRATAAGSGRRTASTSPRRRCGACRVRPSTPIASTGTSSRACWAPTSAHARRRARDGGAVRVRLLEPRPEQQAPVRRGQCARAARALGRDAVLLGPVRVDRLARARARRRQPAWTAWDPSAPAAPKYIVFDTEAGGGIRMAHEAESASALVAELARDPAFDVAARCAVFAEFAHGSAGAAGARGRARLRRASGR